MGNPKRLSIVTGLKHLFPPNLKRKYIMILMKKAELSASCQDLSKRGQVGVDGHKNGGLCT